MSPTDQAFKELIPASQLPRAIAGSAKDLVSIFWRERRRLLPALTAAGAALAGAVASIMTVPGFAGMAGAGLALLAVAIAVIDSRYFVIPDELNAAAMILGLANAAATSGQPVEAIALALLRGSALALIFLGIRAGYRHARGRQGIGLGDVKLAAVAGAWLDWTIMPVVVEAATMSALAILLARRVLDGRTLRRTSRLPFGLFFAPAIWLGWLAQALLLFSL